jgi:putative IMPACT (imprinted ancient) family translation regulator
VLAVLRGRDIGDTVVVVTRFFGGTKLGTGGLVRAYTDAAQEGFRSLAVIRKIERTLLGLELPYPVFEQVKRLIAQHGGEVEEESFAEAVTILAKFPSDQTKPFSYAVSELTSGRVVPIDFGSI